MRRKHDGTTVHFPFGWSFLTFFCFLLMCAPPVWCEYIQEYEVFSPASLVSMVRDIKSIQFCGEKVPLDNRDVKERLESEFLVTLWNRPQIILWLKRATRYMPYVEGMLKEKNMPDDLKYLVIVESSLLPYATSPKGAGGYWQFMDGTAKKYGLIVNAHIDQRRNFSFSTRAALAYLKELYGIFGSWTLAAAAYNMGEDGLKAEILLQKTNNYYLLHLPRETQRYIFRAIAAKIILSNPKKFGFVMREEDMYRPIPVESVEVNCDEDIPIDLIAQAAGTYFKEVKDLNPEIKGYYLRRGKHSIVVPRGGGGESFSRRLREAIQQRKEKEKKYVYEVKRGEDLSKIASRFDVPVRALMAWNDLESPKQVKAGDKIIIFK